MGGQTSSDTTSYQSTDYTNISTTNETTATTSYGLQDAVQSIAGSGNTVTFSDEGAIQAAADLAGQTINTTHQTFSEALGLVQETADTNAALAYDLSSEAINAVGSAYEKSYSAAVETIGETSRGALAAVNSAYAGATGSIDTNKVLLGVGTAGVIAIYLLTRK